MDIKSAKCKILPKYNANIFYPENIGIVYIPTKNRSSNLTSLLSSIKTEWISNFSGQIIIADSSSVQQDEYKSIVQHFSKIFSNKLIYLDNNYAERLVCFLSDKLGLDRDLLRFGLVGNQSYFSAGASRNIGLLLQHGKTALQVDDDIIFNFKKWGNTNFQPRITKNTPILVHPYESRFKMLDDLFDVQGDPFTIYENYFKSKEGNENLYICDECDYILENRLDHKNAHFLTIQNGLYGDACVQRFHEVNQLQLKDKSFRSVSETEYHHLKHSPLVVQSSLSSVISDHPLLLTAYVAIAGSHIFPPFPPIGRAEDFLAGVIANQCCVGSLSLHLDYLVEHNRGSILDMPKITELSYPTYNRILAGIIGSYNYGDDTYFNIKMVGDVVNEISLFKPDSFQDYIVDQIRMASKASSEQFEELLLSNSNLPDYWKNDILKYINELRLQSLLSNIDLKNSVGSNKLWLDIQYAYRVYGYLLKNWPEMWILSREYDLKNI